MTDENETTAKHKGTSKKSPGDAASVQPMLHAPISVTISAFAAAAMKDVTFECSNPNAIVGITAAHVDEAFSGTRTFRLPIGTYSLIYRVQSVGPFAITVTGAEVSHPIDGVGTDSGVRVIRV